MLQRSFIALIITAMTLIGCSESFTPEQSGYWLNRLENETTRIEALKNLGKFKEPAVVDAVINWLEQKGDWQPDAAYTLGTLGDARAIQILSLQSTMQVRPVRVHAHDESTKQISTQLALWPCSRPMPLSIQLCV